MAAVVENLFRLGAAIVTVARSQERRWSWKTQSEYLANDCLDRRAFNSTFQKCLSVKISGALGRRLSDERGRRPASDQVSQLARVLVDSYRWRTSC